MSRSEINIGKAEQTPRWHQELLQKIKPWIPVIAVLVSILTFVRLFYTPIIEITDRQANLEGKVEILLEDRKEILNSYKEIQSEQCKWGTKKPR